MALKIDTQTDYGLVANFWAPKTLHIDCDTGIATITVGLYVDQDAYTNRRAPLFTQQYTAVDLIDVKSVIDAHLIDKTDDFSKAAKVDPGPRVGDVVPQPDPIITPPDPIKV